MKKKDKYTELIANTGVLAIGNFSSKILVFLLVPLYTSVLTTEEYGFYDLVMTTIQLLIPIFTLNVTDGVLRFALENKDNLKRLVNISLKFLFFSLIPAIWVLGSISALGISKPVADYVVYIFLFYLFYMMNQYLIQLAKGMDKVNVMAIAGVMGTLATVTSCLVTLLVIKMGLKGFFFSNILGQALPTIYLICVLRLWKYVEISRYGNSDLQHRLLKYSTPLILSNIGWWLNNTSDKYIITYMSGISLNGLLSVAYKIPSILTIIYGLFIQAWQISAMKEYGTEESESFYNNIFLYLKYFVFFIAAFLILFTKPIAKVAFAKDFYEAWKFVPFLLMSSVFTASASFVAPILTSAYNTNTVAKSTIYGGILNIILNILLLLMIGSQGVAIATAISSFVIFYIRYCGLNGIIKRNYFLKILILWGLLILQSTAELLGWHWAELFFIVIAITLNFRDLREFTWKLQRVVKERALKK
jgi:O-antigen/teichoic acid export membrane protein